MTNTPIEDGWQELLVELPTMTPETIALLRSMFFAGAGHYRNIVRAMFKEDAKDQFDMLIILRNELDKWSWHDTMLETMRMAKQ